MFSVDAADLLLGQKLLVTNPSPADSSFIIEKGEMTVGFSNADFYVIWEYS